MFIVWDRDQAFWRDVNASVTFGFDQRIATRKVIWENPTNMFAYRQILRDTVNGPAHPDLLEARFDFIRTQIEAAAMEDPYKQAPTNQHLGWEWEELRAYPRLKRAAILAQLGP